jgi:hypothetical protein
MVGGRKTQPSNITTTWKPDAALLLVAQYALVTFCTIQPVEILGLWLNDYIIYGYIVLNTFGLWTGVQCD